MIINAAPTGLFSSTSYAKIRGTGSWECLGMLFDESHSCNFGFELGAANNVRGVPSNVNLGHPASLVGKFSIRTLLLSPGLKHRISNGQQDPAKFGRAHPIEFDSNNRWFGYHISPGNHTR